MQSLKNFFHLLTAILANFRYGFPSRKIKIIAVTGTKGKTTTSSYLYQILSAKYKVGLICTTEVRIGNDTIHMGPHVTTPSPFELQKLIANAVNLGLDWLVIETSSHGFDQNRLWGILFNVSVITNIDNDHLDYHHTWERYAAAKTKIIKQTRSDGLVILNQDHTKSYKYVQKVLSKYNKNRLTYGIISPRPDLKGLLIKNSFSGLSFSLSNTKDTKTEKYILNSFGLFNLYNAIAAIAVAKHLSLSYKTIFTRLKNIASPSGRMEVVQKQPFTVIVDFAHNNYSLDTALKNLVELKTTDQKIISVFGCPGRRDHKRRRMGQISAKYSDLTIITADDPRDEGVEAISDQIEKWTQKGGAKTYPGLFKSSKIHYYKRIPGREEAIAYAIKTAKIGDIVYITGMGDQTMMAVGKGEVAWNDKETVLKYI